MNLVQMLRERGRDESRSSITSMDDYLAFLFEGQNYGGITTTWGNTKSDTEAPSTFDQYAQSLLCGNPVVFAASSIRSAVFSQAQLKWKRERQGQIADLFTDSRLAKFQTPWPGGTTSDLLARMSLHADVAGNAFVYDSGERLHMLRPDWVTIVLESDERGDGEAGIAEDATVAGYVYQPNGTGKGRLFMPDEVAHYAPQPDPRHSYRGMSWLSPVVREIQGDNAATTHKHKFFENAATPNLLVKFDMALSREKVEAFKELMEGEHRGSLNAYKTMFLGGGADATVIGKDLQQIDFSNVQGKGETRILMAAGVHPVIAGASEGLSGSSLNAGNYNAAKRAFSDIRLQHMWINAVSSLGVLAPRRDGAQLWFDRKGIPFLQDDLKDTAEIQSNQAQAIRALTEAGYEPASVVAAVNNDDFSILQHTGVFSVQLQAPGTGQGDTDG